MTTALPSSLATALLAAVPARSPKAPLPDSATVRATARAVLARPEFRVDGSTEAGESLLDSLWRFLMRALDAISDFFHWLEKMSPVLAWAFIIGLVAVLVLLVGHIIWTIVMIVRGDRRAPAVSDSPARRKLTAAELARQAEAARAAGDMILGVRLLFRACLAHLEQREGKTFRPGATNHEHLNRYRQTPVYDCLAQFVWVIDSKWYGSEPCVPADFSACHDAYERICHLVPEPAPNAQHT